MTMMQAMNTPRLLRGTVGCIGLQHPWHPPVQFPRAFPWVMVMVKQRSTLQVPTKYQCPREGCWATISLANVTLISIHTKKLSCARPLQWVSVMISRLFSPHHCGCTSNELAGWVGVQVHGIAGQFDHQFFSVISCSDCWKTCSTTLVLFYSRHAPPAAKSGGSGSCASLPDSGGSLGLVI